MVTHEPEIAECADRQIVMMDGKITQEESRALH
jgi:ABC-type lipoprotein export system ATPase subunit